MGVVNETPFRSLSQYNCDLSGAKRNELPRLCRGLSVVKQSEPSPQGCGIKGGRK